MSLVLPSTYVPPPKQAAFSLGSQGLKIIPLLSHFYVFSVLCLTTMLILLRNTDFEGFFSSTSDLFVSVIHVFLPSPLSLQPQSSVALTYSVFTQSVHLCNILKLQKQLKVCLALAVMKCQK